MIAQSETRKPSREIWCDRTVISGILFLTGFTPFAFGSVHPWAYSIMEAVIFVLVVVWMIKIALRGEGQRAKSEGQRAESTERGARSVGATGWSPGAGNEEQRAGSRERGAGSKDIGNPSEELRAGSWEQ